jgi:hypothetical protein
MRTPPFLLGAALLFWGWQTDYLIAGAVMAVVLESPRWVKARWDFADEDFRRIWVFCALLFLGVALFAFTSNGGLNELRDLVENPNLAIQRSASAASARVVAVWLRWAPLAFFPFVAAQAFSSGEGVPPETISLLLRLRWQRAKKSGRMPAPLRSINVTYPYFLVCLFSASFRTREDGSFFWGLCVLLAWAMWQARSRRFGMAVWVACVAVAVGLGYVGGRGTTRLFRMLEDYNVSWFSRAAGGGADLLQSKTQIGRIGLMKGSSKIVIRLEPKVGSSVPPLLRENSYRTYKVEVWYAETSKDRLEPVASPDVAHTVWVLLPEKTNSASVTIGCYLPGPAALLPLPSGAGRLENLSAFSVQKNPLGAVVVEGPGLVVFDALYGPGETIDSPPEESEFPPGNEDIAVPRGEVAAVDQVISELQLTNGNRKAAMRAISSFFQDKFTYSMWQPLGRHSRTNETPLSRFLLRSRAGHCEYFATATVLLLRRLHIPARYAVGYAVHESSGGKYVVRNRDAHAWCIVWNENTHTWQDFDTTPTSWIQTEEQHASAMQPLSDFWSRCMFEFSKFRWGQTHLRQYIVWSLIPVLIVLLYQIVFRRRRRSRDKSAAAPVQWPGLDSEFYLIERELGNRGLRRPPSESLSAWLAGLLENPALAEAGAHLRELLRLHYRYRFDPNGLDGADREALRREAEGCLAALKQTNA